MSFALVEPLVTDPIAPILSDLATCLCAQIEMDGLPPVCTCGVMPGGEVSLDYAGDCDEACGMAWVRLVGSYPSVTIGQPTQRPGNCSSGIGLDIEMGLVRCISVGDGTNPPDPADLASSALLQTADMMALWRAVHCCRNANDFVIGSYAPYGPTGGLVGGVLALGILVT